MANARTMMLHAGAVAQRRSQIERVFRKLEQGPVVARKIYHDLNLPAGDCYECLQWMQGAGNVRQVNREWQLVEDARLSFKDCSTPLLEL
jgi:hypothetical protein